MENTHKGEPIMEGGGEIPEFMGRYEFEVALRAKVISECPGKNFFVTWRKPSEGDKKPLTKADWRALANEFEVRGFETKEEANAFYDQQNSNFPSSEVYIDNVIRELQPIGVVRARTADR